MIGIFKQYVMQVIVQFIAFIFYFTPKISRNIFDDVLRPACIRFVLYYFCGSHTYNTAHVFKNVITQRINEQVTAHIRLGV